MPRSARVLVPEVVAYESSSDEYDYTTIPRARRHGRHGSVISGTHHHHVVREHQQPPPPPPVTNLTVPVVEVGGRKRAQSTSGMPQPNIIINNSDNRSRSRSGSRERVRHGHRGRSRGRYYYEDDDEYEEIYHRPGRISRTPSPSYHRDRSMDYETRRKLDRLDLLEKQEAQDRAQKEAKERLELKRAKEELEREAREKKAKADAKKAVEDWQREEDGKRIKAKKEKEEMEKKVEEETRALLRRAGWTDAEIEATIKGKKQSNEKKKENEVALARMRPTHIKVRREYLLPETLDAFSLPYYYDKEYIIIQEYVSDDFQDELFEHTRKIKSRKLITSPVTKETILKVNDGKRDQMYLVRKKSPAVKKRYSIIG